MRENELLLTKVLNCRRVDLYSDPKPLSGSQQAKISRMKRRMQQGEPIQYVLGSCEFMGLDLLVDKRVLIPRPETELLVETVLHHALSQRKKLRILDIGTGSGNIIISLAKHLVDCSFTAVDISSQALKVAKLNAKKHGLLEKIQFLDVDFLKNPEDCFSFSKGYDIVVSNPPYIKSAQIDFLPVNVQKEPHNALDGGADGLVFYRAIAQEMKLRLENRSHIFLEIGDGQKKIVEDIFIDQGFLVRDAIEDYMQTPRILTMELIKNG